MAPTRNDDPAILDPGTEVSAKFNGAFCEAKIISVETLNVKVKVRDVNSGTSSHLKHSDFITDLKDLRIQTRAQVRPGNRDVLVLQIIDSSQYIVEFNDGDEKTLKRSNLHLKSGKHFDQSISLDNLPLTQPEKISAPDAPEEGPSKRRGGRNPSITSEVTEDSDADSVRRSVRKRKPATNIKAKSTRPKREKLGKIEESEESSQTDKGSMEDLAAVEKKFKNLRRGPKRLRTAKTVISSQISSDADEPVMEASTSKEEDPPPKLLRRKGTSPVGKVVQPTVALKEIDTVVAGTSTMVEYPVRSIICVPQTGRKKCRWMAAVIVHPECRKKPKIDPATEYLVRLFSNSSYQKARKDQVKPFSESLYTAPEEDRVAKLEPDTPLFYLRDKTLPPTWQGTMFTPIVTYQRESPDDDGDDDAAAQSRDDSEDDSEATRFMIQYIKFRDASGFTDDTQPTYKGQPIDVYQLHKAVHHVGGHGGFNRCCADNKWDQVAKELGLPGDSGLAVKEIYRNYLHIGFDNYYRNLATMSIVDIRLGRKRHQPTVMEKEASTSVEPERHVQSPPPKRPRADTLTKRTGPGRPPASGRTSRSNPAPSQVKELSPIVEETKMKSSPGKRGISEEVSRKSPSAADDEWTAIREDVAPDALAIPDTSVLKPGAVVEVLYRNPKGTKPWLPYPARILDNVGDVAFYVHYANWNKRYDEWKPLLAILKVIDLQEVAAKQYVPTSVFQNRVRSKLKGKEWDGYRVRLDRALAFEEATGTGPSAQITDETAKPELEDDQTSLKSQGSTRGRKRTVSRSESGKRGEMLPEGEQMESSPEPLSIPSITSQPEESRAKSKQKSPQPSTSSQGSTSPTPKTAKPPTSAKVDRKPIADKESKPVQSIELKLAEKPKISVPETGEIDPTNTTKSPRTLRRAKFLPEPVAKVKLATEVTPAIVAPSLTPADTSKKDVPAMKESLEQKETKKYPGDDVLRSGASKGVRRMSTAESTRSSTSEKEEKPVELPKKRQYIRKTAAKASAAAAVVQSEPVVAEPEVVDIAKKSRSVTPIATVESSRSAIPAATSALSPAMDVPVSIPTVSLEKDGSLGKSTAVPGEKYVAPKLAKMEVKPIAAPPVQTAVKIVKARKGKMSREEEEAVDVVLKAPAFALEHKAALERLGLPLDGSESTKETIMEEDEYGNFTRLIIEGIDLTDPDLLTVPPLTGTTRIEAYERNLNDSLLMLQLMIHRLATGYYILRRADSIREDAKDETGKINESGDDDAVEPDSEKDKSASSSPRAVKKVRTK